MGSEFEITGGTIKDVKDIKWSYERGLTQTHSEPDTFTHSTIVLVQLALTGAKSHYDGKPVTRATVSFGKPPSGDHIGNLYSEHGGYYMSVTLPLDDLPRFTAALTAPLPLQFHAVANDDAWKVTDVSVLSNGIVHAH